MAAPEIFGGAAAGGGASKATTAGALITGLGALSHSEWLAVGGFLLAVAGFFVNVWFKFDARSRAQREHEARMQRLAQGRSTDTGIGGMEMDE